MEEIIYRGLSPSPFWEVKKIAEKRMYSKKITDSDAFIEMPSTTQALYFHLNQSADDDGFNNQIQLAMMKAHASVDDLKILLMKNFIIRFESGVIVIKHWRIHNTLRRDRHIPTSFQDELKQLQIKDNLSYTLDVGCQVVANGLPQYSIDKNSIDKVSIENDAEQVSTQSTKKKFIKPTKEEIEQYCKDNNYNIDADRFIDYYESNGWMVGRNKMKDWKATLRNWAKREKEQPAPAPNKFHNFEQQYGTKISADDMKRKAQEKFNKQLKERGINPNGNV